MSSPCPDESALAALAEGALGAPAIAALDRHLDQCKRCAETVALLGSLLATPDAPDDAAGAPRLGRFHVLRELGTGATGVVYLAQDPDLRREVAIKVLRPDLAAGGDRHVAAARLLRESRLLARLHHPNIVTVHEVGRADRDVFVVCEVVDGAPADRWVAEAHPSWREIAAIYRQAALGLATAHAAGLLHRDVKPANILVGRDGRARLADFGLAAAPLPDESTRLTRTGAVLGTPAYLAPEVALGDPIDAHSDQFSLCVALGEALLGRRPAPGTSLDALTSRARERGLPVDDAGLRGVLAAVARGIASEPGERFTSVSTLADALVARPPRRPARRLVLAAAAVLGAAALGYGAHAWTASTHVATAPARPATATPVTGTTAQRTPTAMPPVVPTAPQTTPVATPSVVPAARPAIVPTVAPPVTPTADRATVQLERARQAAASYQPDDCLAALDAAEDAGADPTFQPARQNLRATCMMMAGRCDQGSELLRELGRAEGTAASRTADEVQRARDRYCPFDQGTVREQWQRVAAQALGAVNPSQRARCTAIAAHAGTLDPGPLARDNPAGLALMAVASCLAHSGACEQARAQIDRLTEHVGAGAPPPISGVRDQAAALVSQRCQRS